MTRRERRKRRERKKEGEIFYRSFPVAEPVRRTAVEVNVLPAIITNILWYALGIVELILLVRVVLAAFGADGGNLLTSAVYYISYPFVWFFFYLFNSLERIAVTSPRFEIESIAAMAFYYIVIYIVTQLIMAFQASEEV